MRRLRGWSPVLLAVVVVAASPGDPRAKGNSRADLNVSDLRVSDLCARMDRQIAALGGIVMREEISRYDSARGGAGKIDEFEAAVEMADGVDNFAWLKRNGRRCSSEAQIRGAWSYGEFSTVLRISRDALDNQTVQLRPSSGTDSGAAADTLIASFHYPASSARWFVAVAGRIYWLDFQGEIQVSATTGDVQRIAWTSAPPEPEADIRQVQRTVSFAPTEVAGEIYTLPEYAEYRVVHSKERVEWNTARFGNPARYGSLVSVKFGE